MSNQNIELQNNWITEGLIDFEYKKYLLLAYLQKVESCFDDARLYPILAELAFHFENVKKLQFNKAKVEDSFPKTLNKIDLKNMRLEYEEMLKNDEYIKEIEQIIDFAIPRLEGAIENGKDLYNFIEQNLQIFPIGLMPIKASEGYVLVKSGEDAPTNVYEFEISIIQSANDKYRGIRTKFLEQVPRKISNTFQSIKVGLLKKRSSVQTPATFAVESKLSFPTQESVLPIAKRRLMKYLSNYAA